LQEIFTGVQEMNLERNYIKGSGSDSARLRRRLKDIGLSDPAVEAAWPSWWSDEADDSTSARTELRFSLARKLGLDPRSLIEDEEPRFVWRDVARFKHLSGEGEREQAAITSFGRALGNVLVHATQMPVGPVDAGALELRAAILRQRPYVGLIELVSLCWSIGIPVVHLRVFPWPQKRMAAMAVRVADRYAILLGKDSNYPAHVAFYLAHEIGHVASGHLSQGRSIVDFESQIGSEEGDTEEILADRFAPELLTGEPSPMVLPSTERYSARSLAKTVIGASEELKIEPGTLALCFAYSTKDWKKGTAAMRYIYRSPQPVWRQINQIARTQLSSELVPDDSAHYLAAVLGER
jgi:Zn-dependent peptidase ImmA (M78 family)